MLADPVFGAQDERAQEQPSPSQSSTSQYPRLQGTSDEADQIVAHLQPLLPPNQYIQAVGHEANVDTVRNGSLSQYRIVHFATHGFFDEFQPENSGIVLSQAPASSSEAPDDGFLRAPDVFSIDLPADLIILSGCRTGLGKPIRGEGLVGLTKGLIYAGAERVVVSLWSVDDEATVALMTKFYEQMAAGQAPATALRHAQQYMQNETRWSLPYYWAGFVLQGEWRGEQLW